MPKKMEPKQIEELIDEWRWGTLIAVDGNRPYAVETVYSSDGKHIYCATRPGGKMARCIKKNQNIMFKICDIEISPTHYRVVSVFGKAEQLTKREDLSYMINLMNTSNGSKLNEAQCESFVKKLANSSDIGGPIRIAIKNLTGRVQMDI